MKLLFTNCLFYFQWFGKNYSSERMIFWFLFLFLCCPSDERGENETIHRLLSMWTQSREAVNNNTQVWARQCEAITEYKLLSSGNNSPEFTQEMLLFFFFRFEILLAIFFLGDIYRFTR